MKRSLMLTAAVAMILAGRAANAANLTGTYSFVGNDNCVLSQSPFSSEDAVFGGQYGTPLTWTINGSAQGFAVFNGNTGTMTVNNIWVAIQYLGNSIPGAGLTVVSPFFISTYDATIAFTYTVTGDEFTITETSDNGPAFLFGAKTNDGLTVTGAPPVNGTISKNSPPVLQTATGTPAQEVWSFDSATFYAMCLRTRTFTGCHEMIIRVGRDTSRLARRPTHAEF
jgi:hypothetical protein